jgi:hypothetical protein
LTDVVEGYDDFSNPRTLSVLLLELERRIEELKTMIKAGRIRSVDEVLRFLEG